MTRGDDKHHHTGGHASEASAHAGSVGLFRRARKKRSGGFMLVEAMMALSILTVLGMVLLKLSLNILHPRQWIMQQAVTDGYMTYERSFAERIPFENLTANDSPFPEFPTTRSTTVEVGRLPATPAHPNGFPVMGTVVRTRTQDLTNFPVGVDPASVATNPSAMRVWRAQSVLTYRIGNRSYAKSRTVLRSQ